MLGDKLHVGLLFGLGLNSSKFPDQDERNNDWGVDIGGTLQYNLVTWKHLSLYLGGNLVLGVIDPTGDDNTASDIRLQPKLGVQWFFTHMMSLSTEYMQDVVFTINDGNFTNAAFNTAAGGALRLTAYF